VIVGVGVALLFVVAPCCVLGNRHYGHRRRTVAAAPVLTCARLRDDPPSHAAVTARVSVREVITAPVSGEDCVCYWTRYRRGTYQESENRDTWTFETHGVVGRIEIEDATGTAVVTPDLAERRLIGRRGRIVTSATERESTKHTYDADYDVSETTVWLVRPGTEVFVVGAAECDDRGTPLLDVSDEPCGVASRSRAEVVRHLTAWARRWAMCGRLSAVAGLVLVSTRMALIIAG
jgi:hypothetical protein